MKIDIFKIDPNPQQPRKEFDQDALSELCNSIRENGLIQPITVEKYDGRYILVAGERRVRACKLLGHRTIEAHVTEPTNHNGQQLLISAIVENLQRENINPIDEAEAFKKLADDFDMSINDIARSVGKHETQIRNSLKLLEYDPEIVHYVRVGKFYRDARLSAAIRAIPSKEARVQLAEQIMEKQMTIPAGVHAAEKIRSVLVGTPNLKSTPAPAIELARSSRGYLKLDRDSAPTDWDLKSLTGDYPDWPVMFNAAVKTCNKCVLRDIASVEICSECALAAFLISVAGEK